VPIPVHRQVISLKPLVFECMLYFTGSYVANRVSDKLTEIHDRVYCCRSGSAADTQAISDYVRYYMALHR
jgi:hypothetical protein